MPTTRASAEAPRVALVSMPFSAADRPSIQLGLLAALAERDGFATDTYHLNVELAARIPDDYDGLCSRGGRMTGEWLFGVAAFGDAADDDAAYYEAFPDELVDAARGGRDAEFLSSLRHELLPAFVDECLELVDWSRYGVVGFTSTFQQNVASLALARRLKEAFPAMSVLFGGANMEGEMGPECARAFPFIDFVVVGEADQSFPELLGCIADGRAAADVPGVVSRRGSELVVGPEARPTLGLDELPTPRYDEYFERVSGLGLQNHPRVARLLPFESSRGCWWGQKHHCTFCGLNGEGMAFRSKSPDRVLAELGELSRRHCMSFFAATDNIMDLRHVQPLFGAIAEARVDYQFFYEIKANLTPAQLAALYRGGVRWVQPGIESLSTHVLSLMRKGSTMLQNVRLLKWCRYYGIQVSWNLIWGFPGETLEDYRQELELLRLLGHLDPPAGCSRIWLERFSPYFFDQDRFPVRGVQAEASYRHAYPAAAAPELELERLAYFFDYEMDETLPDEAHAETQAWVERWQERNSSDEPDRLSYRRIDDAILIDDARRDHSIGMHEFVGPLATAYELCSETTQTPAQLATALELRYDRCYPLDEIRDALDQYCSRGLMVSEEDRYLSLALPANPNW